MILRLTTLCILVAPGATLLTSPALAQWSNDPAVNLAVGDAISDQNQVKMIPDRERGVWMTWLDGIGTGWDVRIQRLDRPGRELFPHNGLLVANRSFSSTQDYGLATSTNGDALLAYRDTVGGSTEVVANRISPGGTVLWGPSGVALTSGAGFVAAPKIVPMRIFGSDNDSIVGWTENASVRFMRLDELGVPQWAGPVTLTPPTGSYILSDMKAEYGSFMVSMVHQTGGLSSPKHLVAQKFDDTGAAQWGATPVVIFDGGSLQLGNFPTMERAGGGGLMFAWYSASPSLQCFVQVVDGSGVEVWAHNGVAVATTPGQLRVNPQLEPRIHDGNIYVTWKELNGSQSQSGISAQKLDAAGNRLWGSAGATLEPLGPART